MKIQTDSGWGDEKLRTLYWANRFCFGKLCVDPRGPVLLLAFRWLQRGIAVVRRHTGGMPWALIFKPAGSGHIWPYRLYPYFHDPTMLYNPGAVLWARDLQVFFGERSVEMCRPGAARYDPGWGDNVPAWLVAEAEKEAFNQKQGGGDLRGLAMLFEQVIPAAEFKSRMIEAGAR